MSTAVKSETSFFKEFIRSLFKHKGRRPAEVLHHYFWQAPITATIIIINIICFIGSMFLPEQTLLSLINHPNDLFSLKAYTLITAGFLHASIGHLFGNMLALLIFGRIVEGKLGKKGVLLTYFGALLISGIFNSIIQTVITQDPTPGLGASGAIMGVIAMCMLLAPLQITYIIIFPLPISVVGWLYIISDVMGLLGPADGIGHIAHLGGFISVGILGYLFSKNKKTAMKKGTLINIGILVLLLVLQWFLF